MRVCSSPRLLGATTTAHLSMSTISWMLITPPVLINACANKPGLTYQVVRFTEAEHRQGLLTLLCSTGAWLVFLWLFSVDSDLFPVFSGSL